MNKNDSQDQREPTFGEQIVGIKFNPSGNREVENIKQLAAQQIDIVAKVRAARGRINDVNTLIDDAAVVAILQGQMMAVKSVTLGL